MFFYFLKLVQNSGFYDGSKKVYETPPPPVSLMSKFCHNGAPLSVPFHFIPPLAYDHDPVKVLRGLKKAFD
jgi:hypothetical protein